MSGIGIQYEPPRALEFIFSEANGWRSRERIRIRPPIVPGTAIVLMPGTILYPEGAELGTPNPTGFYLPVTNTAAICNVANCVLMYATDHRSGVANIGVEAAVVIRQAELNDAYLLYREQTTVGTPLSAANIANVNGSLRNNGLIVRAAVLAESQVVPYPP